MNEPIPTSPMRSATLTLTSSGPDDLQLEATFAGDGIEAEDGIDRTNVAHNLIDHFIQQLIAGRDEVARRAAEADKPRIVLAHGGLPQ